MNLISNGSVVLLKYKLNNVCDPNRVREPRRGGAQITEQFLYTTICCICQYVNIKMLYSAGSNMYLQGAELREEALCPANFIQRKGVQR